MKTDKLFNLQALLQFNLYIKIPLALVVLLVSTFILGISQPVITSQSAPIIGSQAIFQYTDTVGVSPGMSGANMTWDFSQLTDINTTFDFEVLSVAGSAVEDSFPDANLLVVTGNADTVTYGYIKQTSTLTSFLGFHVPGAEETFIYDDPIDEFSYPIEFGTSYSDDFSFSNVRLLEEGGVSFVNKLSRAGTINIDADAYGTIITPAGTFPNTLRIVRTETSTDSIVVELMGFPTQTIVSQSESKSYFWMQEGQFVPILLIQESTVHSPPFGTEVTKTVYYSKDVVTSINRPNTSDFKLALYPNPAEETSLLTYELAKNASDVRISLISLAGQQIWKTDGNTHIGNHSEVIPVEGLSRGMYFVEILVDGQRSIEKLIVE